MNQNLYKAGSKSYLEFGQSIEEVLSEFSDKLAISIVILRLETGEVLHYNKAFENNYVTHQTFALNTALPQNVFLCLEATLQTKTVDEQSWELTAFDASMIHLPRGSLLVVSTGNILSKRRDTTLAENVTSNLTEREKEILAMIVNGFTNDYISRLTALSLGTVKNYISSIFDKFMVHSRRELISLLEDQH